MPPVLDDLYERRGAGTTFVSRYKPTEVTVGDADSPLFLPHVRYAKWPAHDDAAFALRYLSDLPGVGRRVPSEDRLEWEHGPVTCRFYDLGFTDEGGYEFDVVFRTAPSSPVVRFAVESRNLRFLYQPLDLTPEERALNAARPEHVRGSYALYHATRKGGPYRTGKFGHLFRPQIRDAAGAVAWCTLDLTPTRCTVTIPQEFLDRAVYPVTLDPTLGNSVAGASQVSLNPSIQSAHGDTGTAGFQAAENGTITAVYFYGHTNGSASNITLGVYNQGTNYPGALLADSAGGSHTIAAGSPAWYNQAVSGSLVSGSQYWLAQNHNTTVNVFYYDAATSGAFKFYSSTYSAGTLADPFAAGASTFAGEISAYVEYTATATSAAPAPVRVPLALPAPRPAQLAVVRPTPVVARLTVPVPRAASLSRVAPTSPQILVSPPPPRVSSGDAVVRPPPLAVVLRVSAPEVRQTAHARPSPSSVLWSVPVPRSAQAAATRPSPTPVSLSVARALVTQQASVRPAPVSLLWRIPLPTAANALADTQTRTPLLAAATKTAGSTWTAGTFSVAAGATLLVGIGHSGGHSGIIATWNGQLLTKDLSNYTAQGADTEGTLWSLLSNPLSGTGALTFSWPGLTVVAAAAFATQVSGINARGLTAHGSGGVISTVASTASTAVTAGGTYLAAFVCMQGPSTDTPGLWGLDADQSGQREGTTGDAANTNRTIYEGWARTLPPAPRSARLSGFTGRAGWVALLGTYHQEHVATPSPAGVSWMIPQPSASTGTPTARPAPTRVLVSLPTGHLTAGAAVCRPAPLLLRWATPAPAVAVGTAGTQPPSTALLWRPIAPQTFGGPVSPRPLPPVVRLLTPAPSVPAPGASVARPVPPRVPWAVPTPVVTTGGTVVGSPVPADIVWSIGPVTLAPGAQPAHPLPVQIRLVLSLPRGAPGAALARPMPLRVVLGVGTVSALTTLHTVSPAPPLLVWKSLAPSVSALAPAPQTLRAQVVVVSLRTRHAPVTGGWAHPDPVTPLQTRHAPVTVVVARPV